MNSKNSSKFDGSLDISVSGDYEQKASFTQKAVVAIAVFAPLVLLAVWILS